MFFFLAGRAWRGAVVWKDAVLVRRGATVDEDDGRRNGRVEVVEVLETHLQQCEENIVGKKKSSN